MDSCKTISSIQQELYAFDLSVTITLDTAKRCNYPQLNSSAMLCMSKYVTFQCGVFPRTDINIINYFCYLY